MKLLILYHSNILPPKPGADEHIYTTARLLSKTYDVTVLTWGQGKSQKFVDNNFKIIHIGNGLSGDTTSGHGRIPNFIVDILSFIGIRYIPFLRKSRGPTVRQFNSLELGFYDIAIRVSYNNNRILKYLKEHYGTKIVEFTLVSGLPHYLNNKNEWLKYTDISPALSSKLIDIVYRIMRKAVFWFYTSSLCSYDVIAVSQYDKLLLEGVIKNLRVKYIPPILDFGNHFSVAEELDSIIFFSGNNLSARVAVEYILYISQKLVNYTFYVTGFIPDTIHKKHIPINLNLCGFLEEDKFHDLISKNSIVIMPLIYGTGMQTKVIEAMSYGKAIITTSAIASEFIGIENGRHMIVEDDPEEFLDKIKLLMNDKELRSKISKNAFEYYNQYLSAGVALNLHLKYLNSIINGDK